MGTGVQRGAVLAVLVAAQPALAKDRFEVGEAVPTFKLKAINSQPGVAPYVAIDQYWGAGAEEPKKAVLLSFFATYCEPCKKEMPLLAALHEAYADKGLGVVLVTIDKESDKIAVAKALAEKHGVKFPVLSDRYALVAKRYFISKLPCVYLIDSAGKVSLVNVGYDEGISRRLVDEVRKVLGEPSSDPVPVAISKHIGQ